MSRGLFKILIVILAMTRIFSYSMVFSATEKPSDETTDVLDLLSLGDLLTMDVSTGSFLDLDLKRSPMSMTIITKEMIRSSCARNISELLDIYVPGFVYNYNKWNGTLWALRGVSNDRNTKILYLVDGHKMNSQTRDGFMSETVLGFLGDIERVEVLRGPAGLVYGTGAIAGIINVVTRRADDGKSEVSISGGTDGARAIETNLYAMLDEEQQISVSAAYRESDGFPYDKVRVYGTAGWPGAPGYYLGAPTEGRFGSIDGNWKIAGNWENKTTRLYFRATRQNESTTGLFIRDPWPQIFGTPDSTAPSVVIDGQRVEYNHPYWSNTENWWEARKVYRTDNIMLEGTHEFKFGENSLKLKLSYDRNASQTREDMLLKYQPEIDYLDGRVFETFGEARYTVNGTYLFNSLLRLQAAFGMEYYLDHLGPDFQGRNEKNGNPKHYIITDTYYNMFSLFGEGFYDVNDRIGMHGGLRLDIHTRAIMFNPKIALILHPWKNHSFKLIYQSASNNGSVDNYEYARWHVNDDGTIITEPVLQDENTPPTDSITNPGIIQPTPPLSEMHKLKPEKVHSVEFAYAGKLTDEITVTPSLAWGKIVDLFGWSDSLFRVVNVGQYEYVNADLDFRFSSKKFTFGISHTFQRPVRTDPKKEKKTYLMYETVYDSVNGRWAEYTGLDLNGDSTYRAFYSQSKETELSVVQSSITYDGKHFMSIPDHMTKAYISFSPFPWISFNTSLRLFWGLPGMEAVIEAFNDTSNYFGYYHEKGNITSFTELKDYIMTSVSKKWNAGFNLYLPNDFNIFFNAYNILGTDIHRYDTQDADRNTVNTFRKSQAYYTDQRDLFSTDQLTLGLTVAKHF